MEDTMLKICLVSFLLCVILICSSRGVNAQGIIRHPLLNKDTLVATNEAGMSSTTFPCSISDIKQPQKKSLSYFGNMLEEITQWIQHILYLNTPTPFQSSTTQKIKSCSPISILVTGAPQQKKATTVTPLPTTSPTPTITLALHGQIRLMPLGDSITDGAIIPGGYRIDLWKDLVQHDGDTIDFVGSMSDGPPDLGDQDHEGHIGWTIPQLDASVYGWIRTYQPDIILLHIGTNDLDHGVSPAVMTQDLSKLVGDIFAAKPNTYIVLSTLIVTSHGDQNTWTSFNASIPGIVANYNGQGRKIISLDMSHALSLSDVADGLHPNASGYSKMAGMWYPVVTTIYKQYKGTYH